MKFIIILSLIVLQSCSSAGPFITNISSNGSNGLNIEKCIVKHNGFTNTISNGNCTTQHIQLSAKRKKRR